MPMTAHQPVEAFLNMKNVQRRDGC